MSQPTPEQPLGPGLPSSSGPSPLGPSPSGPSPWDGRQLGEQAPAWGQPVWPAPPGHAAALSDYPPPSGYPTPGQPPPGLPGYGPPPGWGPAPGYGPPPGWGPAPGWGPVPGWGPAPLVARRSRRTRIALWVGVGVAALVLLVGLVAGGVAMERNVVGSSTLTSEGSAADEQALLGTLPASLPDCLGTDLAGDGDIAAADCGPAGAAPAPDYSVFFRYTDADTLDEAFSADVALDYDDGGLFSDGATSVGGAVDCSSGTVAGPWSAAGADGKVACGLTEDGEVLLVWTDAQHLTEGFLYAPGTTSADAAALYQWWQANGALHD